MAGSPAGNKTTKAKAGKSEAVKARDEARYVGLMSYRVMFYCYVIDLHIIPQFYPFSGKRCLKTESER